MRAIIRKSGSEPPTLDPDHPAPTPAAHSNHYLVRAKAAALTRGELSWPEPKIPDVPVPGYDLAGEIISAPTGTTTHAFQPGDQVFALTDFSGKGNAREVTVAREEEIALKPTNLSWEEAASVPLSALTAYEALFVHASLDPPKSRKGTAKRVLVTAAAGGVGVWAVQLGNETGLDITGTCGTSNVDFVKSLGADTVLDYSKTNLFEWVQADFEARSFDVVLDCIGGLTLEDAWKCAKKGGTVISVAEPPDSKKPADGVAEGVAGVWFIVKPNGTALAEIASLVENGTCKPVVDSVYNLEQFKEAFDRLEGGHAKGKVVLKL